MSYDPEALEQTWRDRWASDGRYEATPDADRPSTFVTVPYPYPSGAMHIGHCRTYTVPDVYARFRRQRGDNVLFPFAWHVTGTPIIGAVERLKNRDPDQLETLRDVFGIPEERLEELETPMGFARYFIEESYKASLQRLGLSVDWRREFTTNDDRYSKFITWQYESLHDRGLLERGLHPVKFCTNEENPVTTHDILEGEEAEFQEYTLIRFRLDEWIVPMATLRPETVRGVTNAFVNPTATYVKAVVDGESWIISEAATRKFELQERDVEVHSAFDGADIIGESVTNPVTGTEVTILPATFVDATNATGVVMSVPAHSPDDYVALQELKSDPEAIEAYGIDPAEVTAIEPIPILEIDGYGEIPARDAVEAAGITSTDDPALHDVTAELYQDEFHAGRLLDSYGKFAGAVVEEVRDRFREHHSGDAFDSMYEFSETVICRCGGDVEVAEQETWFLRYNDDTWKTKAHEAVDRIEAIPASTKDQYHHTVDWLEEWPCIRNFGLGTKLPVDEDFVIEPLSDSTIYMAYYTIAHHLRDIPVDTLDRTFFDTLFYGAKAVESGDVPGMPDPREPAPEAMELREEWEYWYPVDFRCSGNDLVQNHLTFYLFHHAELFDQVEWPTGITVMGMGLLEGKSMSSSSGHVVLPDEAINQYGADTVRFFLLNDAEPWQDFDWRGDEVSNVKRQLERFWHRATETIEADAPDTQPPLERPDRWILARLQETVEAVTTSLERFETRSASQAAFYQFEEQLRWYRRRVDPTRPSTRWTEQRILETRLRLLAPIMPYLTNELHEQLSGMPAEEAPWPEPDENFVDESVLLEESLIQDVFDDIRDIVEVTGEQPTVIRLYVSPEWKQDVLEIVNDVGDDIGAIMGAAMQRETLRERGDAVNQLVQALVEMVRGRDESERNALTSIDERTVYEDASGFIAQEFDAEVEIWSADDPAAVDPEGKRSDALPLRPALYLE